MRIKAPDPALLSKPLARFVIEGVVMPKRNLVEVNMLSDWGGYVFRLQSEHLKDCRVGVCVAVCRCEDASVNEKSTIRFKWRVRRA